MSIDLLSSLEERKNYYKVLIYPNITYQKDLNKDSYIVVIDNVIRVLNELRNDLLFYMITPIYMKSWEKYSNVTQLILELPSYPNSMRIHFDFFDIYKLLNCDINDYDIVYSHLPEHTIQLKNLFCNTTNVAPKFIGYCHWYEVSENTFYKETVFPMNIIGTLQMDKCGVNSNWLKELILNKCKIMFSNEIAQSLNQIIQPHYLGCDHIKNKSIDKIKNSIIFNHRNNQYTGWNWFLKCMDALWVKRKDFKVYTTLAYEDKPYLQKIEISDRNEYLTFISRMELGVCCFAEYSAWSISTTDGLSMGVPYLVPNTLCYPEMVGNEYPLFYNTRNSSDFLNKIESFLDDNSIKINVIQYLEKLVPQLYWDHKIKNWFNKWDSIFDSNSFPIVSESKTYTKIKNLIKNRKFMTKYQLVQELNWSNRIPFSNYRNRLRIDNDVYLTKNGYLWKE